MKIAQIYFICVSGIYNSFVQGYNAQGKESFLDLKEQSFNYATEELPLTYPRYSRLVDSYFIRADRQGLENNQLHEARKSNDYLPYAGINGNKVQPEEYHAQSSNSDTVKYVSSKENDLDFVPTKRQQGWYIQYGKRFKGSFPAHDLSQQLPQDKLISYQEKDNWPSLLSALKLRNEIDDLKSVLLAKVIPSREADISLEETSNPLQEAAVPSKDDAETTGASQDDGEDIILSLDDDIPSQEDVYISNDTDDKHTEEKYSENKPDEAELMPEKVNTKRQQGWFISYGKRNDDGYHLFSV